MSHRPSEPRPHDSAELHVTGRARYVDDLPMAHNGLHAYPVFTTVSCGTISAINTEPAERCPGVVRIIRLADIPAKSDAGPVFPGDPLLTEHAVQYHGQPILLVVAQSHEQARLAAAQVKVHYDTQPPLLDIEQAIAQQDWVRPPLEFLRGEPDTELQQAPYQLHGTVSSGGQEHFYLEGQVAMTVPAEDGGMLVYSSTQHPSEVQKLVADVLGQPLHCITVETRRLGGGFGGKETQAAPWAALAAVASWHTGCAVKLRLVRGDDFRSTGKRHPFLSYYRVGFDADGRILACDLQLNGYCGHSPDLSDAIVDRAMFHADNAYYYPAVRIVGNRCRSNTVSHTAFRGFGGPQGMLVAECMLDDIARSLQLDPLLVRQRNLYRPGQNVTPYGQTVEQFVLFDMIEQLKTKARYDVRREQLQNFNAGSPVIKRGMAMTPVKFGISFTVKHLNQAGALLHIYTDGSIHLNHGGTEMGQGLHTKVRQIVAHCFAVPVQQVYISATRTDKVPNTSATAASSGTDLNGMAAWHAATTLKDRLIEFAADRFQLSSENIQFSNGQVHCGAATLSFGELAALAYQHRISLSATGYYATPTLHFDRAAGKGKPFYYFTHGVAVSEVEVDVLTGENCVRQVDILFDAGHSLNPAIDIGQIEGGFVQAMGWLTTEDLVWQKDGALASAGPATYKIPTAGDTPTDFNVALYHADNPAPTIFHSKAIGEPPFMLANSVWCALRDAIASLADYRYSAPLSPPATPERILHAVNATREWALTHAKGGTNE